MIMNRMIAWVCSLCVLFFISLGTPAKLADQPHRLPSGYRIETTVPLTPSENGINGKLQLLVDKSLPANLHKWNPSNDRNDHGHALLQLMDANGRVVSEDTLARAVAYLEPTRTLPGKPAWMTLTVDYSVGWGEYAGPTTSFVRVRGGKLEWLTAADKKSTKK